MSSIGVQGNNTMIGHPSFVPNRSQDGATGFSVDSFSTGPDSMSHSDHQQQQQQEECGMFSRALQTVAGNQLEDLKRQLKEAQLMGAELLRKEQNANMRAAMSYQMLADVEQERDSLLGETEVLKRQRAMAELMAADISNDKESLEKVVSATIDSLRMFIEEDDLDGVIADWSLVPHAVGILGKLALGAAVTGASVDQIIEKSCEECESFSMLVAEQKETIAKMREVLERAILQRKQIVAENDSLRVAVKELEPLAGHCMSLTSDIERLKEMLVTSREIANQNSGMIKEREEQIRRRVEALDNVPAEKIYAEFLASKNGMDRKKLGLLLTTLVTKVRLLSGEIRFLRERNEGLMNVVLTEASDDPERKAEIEYLRTCLKFKDAVEQSRRWDGAPVHDMEEQSLSHPTAEKIILAASGAVEAVKQKNASKKQSIVEGFNDAMAKLSNATSDIDRQKALISVLNKRLDDTVAENTRLKIEMSRLQKQAAMSYSERSVIIRQAASACLAAAGSKDQCSQCVELVTVNQELLEYQRMEEARFADAANERMAVQKECDGKLAEMQKKQREEIQGLATKREEHDRKMSNETSALKRKIAELEDQVKREKERAVAREAREQGAGPAVQEIVIRRQEPVARQESGLRQEPCQWELCRMIARDVAFAVLHPTWRGMEITPQVATEWRERLKNKNTTETVLAQSMGNETLAQYVLRTAKNCIKVNDALSKQVEKEKAEVTELMMTVVQDCKQAMATALSSSSEKVEAVPKATEVGRPDIVSLRKMLEDLEDSPAHHDVIVTALKLAFDTCARYIDPSANPPPPPPPAPVQSHRSFRAESDRTPSPVTDKFEIADFEKLLHQTVREPDPVTGLFNGKIMQEVAAAKRIAESPREQEGRKKLHKSGAPVEQE